MTKAQPAVKMAEMNYDGIIGLDMSLTASGLAWQRLDLPGQALKTETLHSGKLRGQERLVWIREGVGKLLSCFQQPLVLLEGYAFGARGAAMVSLGELGGIIRVLLYERGIPFQEIPPTQAKKFCCGSGTAAKELILKDVFRQWGADLNDNNQADAYVLVQMGLALIDQPTKKLTKAQQEVLKKL